MTLQAERESPGGLDWAIAPRVVVVVGSDHHPFDRLIEWIARWLREHPEQCDSFFVQLGTASAVPPCMSTPLLRHDALGELLGEADVVVAHGGPGSALDCWNKGILPILVPRLRRFGECVDDHQLDFCRAQQDAGRAVMAESYEELRALLEKATSDPGCFRTEIARDDVSTSVARFAELVDALVQSPRSAGLRRARTRARLERARTRSMSVLTRSFMSKSSPDHVENMTCGRKEQQ